MRKIVWAIFFLVFAACLATVNYFNHYYAERALQSDAEQLLFQFHDALVEAYEVLDALPDPERFECNEETVAQLAQLTYEHPAVRLLGVLHGDQQACASQPVQIDLSHYYERAFNRGDHKLADDLFLSTAGYGDGHLDLLMIRSHGLSRYFASINPFMVDYLSEFACVDCLEYDFIIDGEPKLEFRSRAMNQPTFIEHKASRIEEDLNVDLYIRCTQTFYNYYKQLSWLSTIAFSAILATIIALLSYRLLTVRQSLERVIKDALRFSEFVPFYQPIVDSRDGRVVGAEMLARWRRNDGTIVLPHQFIPVAEDSGLIINITRQLIEKTVGDIGRLGWHEGDKYISLNIVPEHLKSDRLFELVDRQLKTHRLPAKSLSIEITERMQIDDLEEARRYLEDFYRTGIELKLDDAGTGYGGFSYIQELAISTLKIDKMFVDTIASDDVKGSVLESIISFAKASNLEMIAEGVENERQVQYLKERGVFYIQGYVYAKPMPLAEFQAWLVGNTPG